MFPYPQWRTCANCLMTCNVEMVINGAQDPKIFLKSFPKSSFRLPNVILIILHSLTLIPVDYFTFLCDGVLFLESHQEVLHSLKYTWMPILLQMFLKLSPNPLMYSTTLWMLLSLVWLFVCLCLGCCYTCGFFLS